MTLDHLKLVDGDLQELKKLRTCLLGTQIGEMTSLLVEHEADGSCCRREGWLATWERIATAINAPVKTVAINIDHTKDGIS